MAALTINRIAGPTQATSTQADAQRARASSSTPKVDDIYRPTGHPLIIGYLAIMLYPMLERDETRNLLRG